MHILQIYKDYFPVLGGIENHVRDLSEALAARGHRITVLVTSMDGCTTTAQPQPGLMVIKAARSVHLASTPLSLAMLQIARSQHPDLVHLHFPYPPGDLAAMALPQRTPAFPGHHTWLVRASFLCLQRPPHRRGEPREARRGEHPPRFTLTGRAACPAARLGHGTCHLE